MKSTLFSSAACFVRSKSRLLQSCAASIHPGCSLYRSFFELKHFTKSICEQTLLDKENASSSIRSNVVLSIDQNPDSLLKNIPDLNQKKEATSNVKDPNRKASIEQLIFVKNKIANHLPNFLKEPHPYSLYTPDVIFENFYEEPGKTTVGALQYAVELTKIRWRVNLKYSNTRIDILKITHDASDGTVKVRWRLRGIHGLKTILQPWKFKIWKIRESIRNESEWHDGFSILYVRGDGLVYKHTLSRVMTQKDENAKINKLKNFNPNFNLGSTL